MIQTTTNSDRAGHGAGNCAGLEGAFGRTDDVAAAVSAAVVVVGVAEAVAVGSADGDEDQMTATEVVLMVLSGDYPSGCVLIRDQGLYQVLGGEGESSRAWAQDQDQNRACRNECRLIKGKCDERNE